jgi:ABC-type phosphate transport system ATPase subunit
MKTQTYREAAKAAHIAAVAARNAVIALQKASGLKSSNALRDANRLVDQMRDARYPDLVEA